MSGYGKQLRHERKKAGVSAAALAEALGYSDASAVTRKETGRRPLSRTEYAAAIAAIVAIAEERAAATDPAIALELAP